jgi:hypothetical protein
LLTAIGLSVLAIAGCGGDDDEPSGDGGSGGGGITGAEPSESKPPSTKPEPDAPTAAELRSCLTKAGVKVVGESESYVDAEGETTVTGSVEIDGSEYVGLALWPTKHVAYVYVSPNESAADEGEKEMEAFVKAFGGDPAKYVQRQGTVLVMLDDEEEPTPAEAKTLDDCARGA